MDDMDAPDISKAIRDLGIEYEKPNTNLDQIRCPCCHGQGTQFCVKSGMRELCPACDGRGKIKRP